MFLDWSCVDLGRVKKAKALKLVNVNEDATYAECNGSAKEPYIVHESYCSCPDYKRAANICKHMIALADIRGDFNIDSFIEEEEIKEELIKLKTKLSNAFSAYHLFNNPIMSDRDYDVLRDDVFLLNEKYKKVTGMSIL